jgi:hypothetical protein
MSVPRSARHHDGDTGPRVKWLYLELAAAYLADDRPPDPLGTVEELYSAFVYPAEVPHFLRYAPVRRGTIPGSIL